MQERKIVKILVLHQYIFSYEWVQEMFSVKPMALPCVVDMN